MRAFRESLFELYRAGAITYEDAMEACHDEADFQRLLERGTGNPMAQRRPLQR